MKRIAIDKNTEALIQNASRLPTPIKIENGYAILTKNQYAKLKFTRMGEETDAETLLRIATLYA